MTQISRVKDPLDPRRCMGAVPEGQCLNESEPGSDCCRAHGGRNKAAEEDVKRYLLNDLKARLRLAQLSDPDPIRELRDAIALNHMMIERRLNLIHNDIELMAACGQVNQMLLTMERLVKTAHTIEQELGGLLAKQQLMQLAHDLVVIVIDQLEGVENYEQIVDAITDQMLLTIQRAGAPADAQPKRLTAA